MYGMKKHQIERIIRNSLSKNPDLKYYIDNDYIEELMNLVIDGVCQAIEENNKRIFDDITKNILRKH